MAKVSIYTQVYNAGKFLKPCIDSVLAQTHTDWEHIIADAGSTDGSVEILKEYAASDSRVKFIQLPENRWSQYEMTEQYATGEYYASLDHDDWWEPEFLERLILFLQENDLDIAITGVEQYYEELQQAKIFRKLERPVVLSREQFANQYEKYGEFANARWASLMYLKQYLSMKKDYYDVNNSGSVWRSDTILMLKFIEHFQRIGIDNSILQHYRVHSKSQLWQNCFGRLQSEIIFRNALESFFRGNNAWSIENQNFLHIKFLFYSADALQAVGDAPVPASDKLKECGKFLENPCVSEAMKCEEMPEVNLTLVFYLAKIVITAAADKDILRTEIIDFQAALQKFAPNCAKAICPESFRVFAYETNMARCLVMDKYL